MHWDLKLDYSKFPKAIVAYFFVRSNWDNVSYTMRLVTQSAHNIFCSCRLNVLLWVRLNFSCLSGLRLSYSSKQPRGDNWNLTGHREKLVLSIECKIEELNQSNYHWQHSIIWHFHLNKVETLELSLCCCPTVLVSWPEIENKHSPVLSIDSICLEFNMIISKSFVATLILHAWPQVLTLLALLTKDNL